MDNIMVGIVLVGLANWETKVTEFMRKYVSIYPISVCLSVCLHPSLASASLILC